MSKSANFGEKKVGLRALGERISKIAKEMGIPVSSEIQNKNRIVRCFFGSDKIGVDFDEVWIKKKNEKIKKKIFSEINA